MNWLMISTWILTVVSLIGTILNVKKIKYCFYIWTVSNTLWLCYDIYTGLYSRAALDLVHLLLAVWGIFAWHKKGSKK
jgi:nicotinamide riboside transporter PnuC